MEKLEFLCVPFGDSDEELLSAIGSMKVGLKGLVLLESLWRETRNAPLFRQAITRHAPTLKHLDVDFHDIQQTMTHICATECCALEYVQYPQLGNSAQKAIKENNPRVKFRYPGRQRMNDGFYV